MTLRVLLVEPYLGGSHQAWAEGYARFSAHEVIIVGHEARFWKWRMQGGFLTLAHQAAEVAPHPDVILASSMLHLPGFRGVFEAAAPTVLYMHENQLTYPPTPGTEPDLTYPMTNWVSMAVADRVWFNSEYHRTAWFEELPRLLKHFPDYTHLHLVDDVEARSAVVPVGVDLRRLDGEPSARERPPLVLWNQRWDYDKNPAEFFAALDVLAAEGVPFRVAIAGENFRNEPDEFAAARDRLGDRVVQFGLADERDYRRLLRAADVVVSTAHQEFFGIAIVEAVYAGAYPVLPNRLSYPGLVPVERHHDVLYDDFDGLVGRLRWALLHPEDAAAAAATLGPTLERYDWAELAPVYDELLTGVVSG